MSTRSNSGRKARALPSPGLKPKRSRSQPPKRRLERGGGDPARRAVLAEWRGVDLTSDERAWGHGVRPSGAILSKVLEGLRLEERRGQVEILKVWNRLIDPNVASHAQPVGLRRGTLFVAVDSSVWLTEIVRYRQQEILERLHASFGKQLIRRISFRIG